MDVKQEIKHIIKGWSTLSACTVGSPSSLYFGSSQVGFLGPATFCIEIGHEFMFKSVIGIRRYTEYRLIAMT